MKVIGSGFGRTGTLSLKIALEVLGFGPCYHMEMVLRNPEHIRSWGDLARGRDVDVPTLLSEFQSCVDFPACLHYQQLLDRYPDAKVIHTIRDPNDWYESTLATSYRAGRVYPLITRSLVPRVGRWTRMQDRIIWQGVFDRRFATDREAAIRRFEMHTEAVISRVPADQLLLYRVADGWGPLCEFLGVPIPEEPFPHLNERAGTEAKFRRLRTTAWVRAGASTMAGLIIALALVRGLRRHHQERP
jgi:hypothetical protein